MKEKVKLTPEARALKLKIIAEIIKKDDKELMERLAKR